MSLLDTFSILFETDAEKAEKDVDKLSKTLDGTERASDGAADGFTEMDMSAQRSAESVGNLSSSLRDLLAAYLSFSAVKAFVFDQAVATDVVGKFSETLGLNIEKVDAWGEAVIRNGGSAESFRGSVESLNDALTDASIDGAGEIAETLARLGISATDSAGRMKSVFNVLPELADSFQRLSKQEAVGFGRKLGLDQGTILLLQQGRVAVEDLVERQRQLGGRTEEGYKASAIFNDTMADTSRVFVGMADTANQVVLPVLTKILVAFQDGAAWMSENSEVTTAFFVSIAAAITAFYLPAMVSAAAATLAATWPILAIGAAVVAASAAIALMYEDVKAYIGGQSSFIGDLAEKYEWFGDIIDGLIGGISAYFEVLGDILDWIMKLILAPGEAIDQLTGKITGSFSGIKDTLSDAFDFGGEMEAQANGAISVATAYQSSPMNSTPTSSYGYRPSNKTYSYSFGDTNVDAKGLSGDEAAQAVSSGISEAIKSASGQFEDGVDY